MEKNRIQCFIKILNSEIVQRFMKSLVFIDAKRSINKDLLMKQPYDEVDTLDTERMRT